MDATTGHNEMPKANGGLATRRITYYAYARNSAGKIGQLLVVRENGRQVSEEWTGVTYPSAKAAHADMARLNCAGAQ